ARGAGGGLAGAGGGGGAGRGGRRFFRGDGAGAVVEHPAAVTKNRIRGGGVAGPVDRGGGGSGGGGAGAGGAGGGVAAAFDGRVVCRCSVVGAGDDVVAVSAWWAVGG